MITKTIPISTRIVTTNAMKQAIPCEYDGKSMETEATTWSEFPNRGKAIVKQILASEEKKKSKTARLWEWQSGIWVEKLTIWVRSYEIMTEFTRSISFTRIDKRHKSKDKHICRWVDQGNLIYVRWNRIKNHAQRWRRWLMEEKEVRHWV